MTTKLVAFFEFDFSNSATTFKFLLFALGPSSILISSMPFVTLLTEISPFWGVGGAPFCFRSEFS